MSPKEPKSLMVKCNGCGKLTNEAKAEYKSKNRLITFYCQRCQKKTRKND